ncbi:hypothetical protein [Achromobacter sp. NFACC18-2]|uniref:hypothetical protein n=1 Tax=Achromobacter sp. NFACC18-2 TaxID=1564112 RepID=UPI0008C2FE5D|nr:hypothetical protein [Achromobacter sp. NFACC18-2]SEK09543.1 hypothetical protein SAMN03159494_05191 [Achromobacter sp. NFACC18-2]
MTEPLKIQALEKVGYVGSCQSSPSSYASYMNSSWSKPTPERVAAHALAKLEEARQKDVAAHELNIPRIEINKAIHDRVTAMMAEVGMPSSWSEPDRKSRARFPKSIRHDAGYLQDLRREAKTGDGFEYATATYERLKKSYEEYAEQAKREAEVQRTKAQREREAEEAKRREDMELAAILIRYELDVMSTWSDVLEALRLKDKYLDLAIAGQRTRGDWSEGPWQVRNALDRFTIEGDTDKDIVVDLSDCLADFEDGRVFRDTTWNYDRLYGLVKDEQLLKDAQLANDKSRSY